MKNMGKLNKSIFFIPAVFLAVFLFSRQVNAHSGRTDSSGGHNCNVGSCAGTYHYHNGGGYTPPTPTYTPPVAPKPISPSNYTPPKPSSSESTNAKPADINSKTKSSSGTEDDSFGGGLALGALGAGAVGWYINKKNKK